jgi:methylaspartate ammonia-lyase
MFFKNVPILPEILPSKTLDTISRRGLSHLSCDRYAKATAMVVIFCGICDKYSILKSFPLFGQAKKRRSPSESVAPGKGLPR